MMDQFDQQFFLYRKLNEYMEIPGIGELLGEAEGSRWTKSNTLMRWVNLVSEEALDGEVLRAAERAAACGCWASAIAYYMKQLEEKSASFSPRSRRRRCGCCRADRRCWRPCRRRSAT